MNKINYILFQMKSETLKKNNLAMLGYDFISNPEEVIIKENYNQVYSGICAEGGSRRILEQLFEEFNINHPEDFKGRSMSVSDVVVFIRENRSEYWFCDTMGFRKINGLKWLGLEEI